MTAAGESTVSTLGLQSTAAACLEPGDRTVTDIPTLTVGARIGRNVVMRALGAGAMGVVYEAHDPELGRTVAIKVLRTERAAGDSMIARLRREARALAQLAHPNVVAIHDVGVHDGAPFLAMEYIDGVTLRQWLESETRSWREIVRVFEQAARGLAAAHVAGLVHRDFKPDNVMIGRDARVRVTDFGLARAEDATVPTALPTRGHVDEVMTASGAWVGTPAYMAPEQFTAEAVNARADQFSFMVALYEALCGQRPWSATSIAELALAVTERPASSLPAALPRALRDIVARGLSRSPVARHRDMGVVADALAATLRRRSSVWLLASAAVVATGGVALAAVDRDSAPSACETSASRVGAYWNASTATRVRERVGASAVNALDGYAGKWRAITRETCDARGSLPDALVDARMLCLDSRLRDIEALAALWQESAQPAPGAVFALPALAECTSNLAAITPAPVLTPAQLASTDRVRRRIAAGTAKVASGHTDAGLGELRAAAEEAERAGIDSLAGEAMLAIGVAELGAGLALDARRSLERARVVGERAKQPLLVADSLARSVGAMTLTGELQEALRLAAEADAAITEVGSPERLTLLLLRHRGHAHFLKGDGDAARADLTRAHELTLQLFGADSVDAADSERMLASLAAADGQLQASRAHLDHALATVQKLHGDDHPTAALVRVQRCTLLARVDDRAAREDCRVALRTYERAGDALRVDHARALWLSSAQQPERERLAALERARAILREATGSSLIVAQVTADIAATHFDAGRYREAAGAVADQIDTLERALGREHPRLAERYGALGRARMLANDIPGARTAFERGLALYDAQSEPDPNAVLEALLETGNMQIANGDNAAGLALFDRAVALVAQSSDATSRSTATALLTVGTQLASQGNHDVALSYLTRALATSDAETRIYVLTSRAGLHASMGQRQLAVRDIAAAKRLLRRVPVATPMVELAVCGLHTELGEWRQALRTCSALAAATPKGDLLRRAAETQAAQAQIELGDVATARATLEELAASPSMTPSFAGPIMFELARARSATGDVAGAVAAADVAQRALEKVGAPGERTLAKLRDWRKTVAPIPGPAPLPQGPATGP